MLDRRSESGLELPSRLDFGDFMLPMMLEGRDEDGLGFWGSVVVSLLLRPRNDSKPPPAFLLTSGVGVGSRVVLSIIRQPGGRISS